MRGVKNTSANHVLRIAQRELTIMYAAFLIIFIGLFTATPIIVQSLLVAGPRAAPPQAPLHGPIFANFTIYLLLINGLFVIAAVGASYFLARKTLRPLETTLTQQEAFAAEVAHELKTPLANILMQVSSHRKTHPHLAQEEQTLLIDVENQIKSLGQTADNLLKLMAVEFADPRIYKQTVDLSRLAQEVTDTFIPQAVALRIKLSFNAGSSATVLANPLQVRQLMTILLDNALKYTPAGGTVTVSVKTVTSGCLLAVEDTGIGINARDLPRIFDRFYQAGPTNAAEGHATRGAGLGLAIAQRIASLHGSHIKATSYPGKGTRMEVILLR